MSVKIGSLIASLQATELSKDEQEMLQHPLIGGIILFTRNYESREQLAHLCHQIRAARKTPLLIMVDQEGGRVQRFIPEFTRLPRMSDFGDLYEKNPQEACRLAQECGWLMAAELVTLGVDASLAPVLDLNKGINTAINGRGFHVDASVVVKLATAFMAGMREAGMAATGKHFPGHGSVTMDSHIGTPIDNRALTEIQQDDLKSFAGLIKADIPAIMAAHIIFPQVDSQCVGFSSIWLKDILRKQMQFKGIIISDDLNMEGANISANYADRVAAARDAGCDIVLLCNNPKGVIQALDHLPYQAHLLEEHQWRPLQAKTVPIQSQVSQSPRWMAIQQGLEQLKERML